MPIVQQGSIEGQQTAGIFTDGKISYEYPEGLNLHPDSTLHKKLKSKILRMSRESNAVMSRRHDSWRRIDQLLTAYIPTSDAENKVVEDDIRKPVSIIFPYTYSIMETLLAYLTSAFLPDPIFRYEGVGPEDVIGSILMEHVVGVHSIKSKIGLNLHTMFRDSLSYGLGVTVPSWKVHKGFRTVRQEEGFFSHIFDTFKQESVTKETEEVILYEGNALKNIDPYKYLPDPNVAVHEVQDGEFVGWLESTNFVNLLSTEVSGVEDLFNVKFLQKLKGRKSSLAIGDQSDREKKFGKSSAQQTEDMTQPVDVIYMYVKLIPKEWDLGNSENPEKWLFGLAADEIIIKAQPLDLNHNMFPVAVSAPDFDGYSITPLSRLEMLEGLQKTVDWLFNSHIANVRKAINDMLIVDPYLVNINDLKSPEPGKIIRMRRPAWGRGVKDGVQQLVVNDVTRSNIADTSWIVQWMQKIGAADDPMMGSLRQGGPERLTGAEFKGTQFGAVSRIERVAKMIGMQAMQDIGTFFASHTQQFMDQDTYIKVAGNWQDVLLKEYGNKVDRGRISVSPFDLLVNYDVIVRDGSVPGGNFSDVWLRMFDIIAGHPELAQQFDTVRIFKHIARNAGAKNINEFVRRGGGQINQINQSSDQIEQGLESGNIVPLTSGEQNV